MAFPKFGSTPRGVREKAAEQLPPINDGEMDSVPPAIADARRQFRTLMLNYAEREGGGTNLNRTIQRDAANMHEKLKGIGLRANDVAFPEDQTELGRKAREYLAPYGAQSKPRDWKEFEGERSTYTSTSAGVHKARDLTPLSPWEAPDDSPASRARLARRDAINMSIEGEYNRINGRYPQPNHAPMEDAVKREKAALGEIGLDHTSIRYPEDSRAMTWANVGKAPNAVDWGKAAALDSSMTFERKDGDIKQVERPTGIADYAQRILKEAQVRTAIKHEDGRTGGAESRGGDVDGVYDRLDRSVADKRPSLAVRAAMAVNQLAR